MRSKFQELLLDLSEKLELDLDLHVDKNRACSILFEDVEVQLELDGSSENLIVFTSIAEIPAGKYREKVLLDALKANNEFPYIAIFAYFEIDASLSMHNFLDFATLNADILSSYLATFVELAQKYKKAVERGQTSIL
ncbi:MAG: hypothetical protein KR126chlam4_01139 [Candidatus Anoxychlamydiales bacterium]|uniref:Uncharacterized protein n=1 Tax=marine sediment metagenome TaxID=412755 RepID=A0A0F9BCM7_9ZZZZ|nr:hypothetical protein [Candidatus Anoxychlamydiales bacterium]HEU64899.1 hypothetical protein [Chlamydiota bacterium]